jgi:hypothetical protein
MNRRESLVRPVVPMNVADREVEKLIDRLDRAERRHKAVQTRAERRIPFRCGGVVLSLDHPGLSNTLISVWTRNISRSGVGVLLGAFVHPGTQCDIELPRADGGKQTVFGIVQWCRLIQGIVHELGIKFEEELDLEQFVNIAVLREHQFEEPLAAAAIVPEDLNSTVRLLLQEVEELIQLPRLSRALAVCEKLQECGEDLGREELSKAAWNALTSLRATNSVARSEPALRKLRRVEL